MASFTYSYTDEPHATRRKLILQKYPQIKKLMTIDKNFKWQVTALVLAQIVSFWFLKDVNSFWVLLGLAYCVGGVANHAIMLAIHEISHGMAFGPGKPFANKLMSIFANLPIGIPMSISFKKYHLDHHRYQGDELLDTDVPTFAEASFFNNPIKKFIWCLLQPFFYTLRPLFVNPKPLDQLELTNIIVQIIFDLFIVTFFGWHILAYMVGGSILAMGLHPVAGHFISEHTLLFHKDQREKNSSSIDENGNFLVPETCSYYGPLNWVTFNVGYHVEHHDFPSIPGSKLHQLSKIAPEFYLKLNYHTSWTYVLWQYITDPRIGPSSRVRRPHGLRKDKIF